MPKKHDDCPCTEEHYDQRIVLLEKKIKELEQSVEKHKFEVSKKIEHKQQPHNNRIMR